MKNKILAAVVPVAAFAALAGTGFGSWYFATAGATEIASASVAVTGVNTEKGTITVDHATFYLGLDQVNNCYWTSKDPNAEDTVNEGYGDDNGQISTITAKYTLGTNVDYSAINNEVISMTGAWASEGTNEYVTVASTASTEVTLNWDEGVATGVYTLPAVSWVEGKKPTTKTAYEAMKTALASVSFTLTFSVAVSA